MYRPVSNPLLNHENLFSFILAEMREHVLCLHRRPKETSPWMLTVWGDPEWGSGPEYEECYVHVRQAEFGQQRQGGRPLPEREFTFIARSDEEFEESFDYN